MKKLFLIAILLLSVGTLTAKTEVDRDENMKFLFEVYDQVLSLEAFEAKEFLIQDIRNEIFENGILKKCQKQSFAFYEKEDLKRVPNRLFRLKKKERSKQGLFSKVIALDRRNCYIA